MIRQKLQTLIDISTFPWKTAYNKRNVFMGSCFSENVGNKMAELKYQVDNNPFGILYNPASMAKCLQLLLEGQSLSEKDLSENNGLWYSFSHHGKFSSPDKTECLKNINKRIQFSAEYLKKADFLFLTFGTAWVYRYKKSGEVVANCHKIPANEFSRERLSLSHIIDIYTNILERIWEENPTVKIVFTVSPIRHWKDGAVENQISKATLLLAVHQLTDKFGGDKCAYFPSYEIVMDELRDYRFYAEDMVHLNATAVNYIWSIFQETLVEKESIAVAKDIQKVVHAMQHRPINKNTEEFYKFVSRLLQKVVELEKQHPFLNFKLEKEYFNLQKQEIRLKS